MTETLYKVKSLVLLSSLQGKLRSSHHGLGTETLQLYCLGSVEASGILSVPIGAGG